MVGEEKVEKASKMSKQTPSGEQEPVTPNKTPDLSTKGSTELSNKTSEVPTEVPTNKTSDGPTEIPTKGT